MHVCAYVSRVLLSYCMYSQSSDIISKEHDLNCKPLAFPYYMYVYIFESDTSILLNDLPNQCKSTSCAAVNHYKSTAIDIWEYTMTS